MKSKTQDKSTKTSVEKKAKDLKPKKDAKGGLLLPAVQKVREAAGRGG